MFPVSPSVGLFEHLQDDAAGNCSNEQGSRGPAPGLNAAGGGDEDGARAFIIQVRTIDHVLLSCTHV